mgnify:CR=1 FL=1
MMNNGKECSNNFSKLLTDSDKPINVYKELLKSLLGLQRKHTLPALGLALVERFPIPEPKLYIQRGKELKQELKEILGNDGVLLFPSFPYVAPYHNQPLLTTTMDYIYYGIFNALGLPVTQIPLGLSKNEQLPTGVQLVANDMCDHLTIKLAEHFEKNLVGWVKGF